MSNNIKPIKATIKPGCEYTFVFENMGDACKIEEVKVDCDGMTDTVLRRFTLGHMSLIPEVKWRWDMTASEMTTVRTDEYKWLNRMQLVVVIYNRGGAPREVTVTPKVKP